MATFGNASIQIMTSDGDFVDLSDTFDEYVLIDYSDMSSEAHGLADVEFELTLKHSWLCWVLFGYDPILAFKIALLERLSVN